MPFCQTAGNYSTSNIIFFRLNILIAGCQGHQLHLFIYGVFPVARGTIEEQNGMQVFIKCHQIFSTKM